MRALADALGVTVYVTKTRQTLARRISQAHPERWRGFIRGEHLTETGEADLTHTRGPHARGT